MSAQIFFLSYASSAATPFSQEALAALLETSRRNNERDGLTGMLLYRGGNFLQALEGPEAIVKHTMLRISRDQRHRSIVPLFEQFQPDRLFRDWSMGFEDVSDRDPADFPGLNDFLTRPDDLESNPRFTDHDVYEFFRAFRDYMR